VGDNCETVVMLWVTMPSHVLYCEQRHLIICGVKGDIAESDGVVGDNIKSKQVFFGALPGHLLCFGWNV
jgi:hypothetical protein